MNARRYQCVKPLYNNDFNVFYKQIADKRNEIGRLDVFWCSNALKDGFKLRSLLYKFVFGYFDDNYN